MDALTETKIWVDVHTLLWFAGFFGCAIGIILSRAVRYVWTRLEKE